MPSVAPATPRTALFRHAAHLVRALLATALVLSSASFAVGQDLGRAASSAVDAAFHPSAELPDAPSAVVSTSSSRPEGTEATPPSDALPAPRDANQAPGQPGSGLPRSTSRYDAVVAAGQVAPPQTSEDKFVGSLKTSISPFSIVGSVIAAGYAHLTDGSPNYGTNSTAFGERVGAAVARGTSQTIFSSGIVAPLIHQDTRYYQLGSGYSVLHRGVYAATRPLIGRTDSGRKIPNIALLSGYFGAAVLTRTYYPVKNQTFSENMQTYGSSLGGAAIGSVVHEFLPQLLQAVHLKKND